LTGKGRGGLVQKFADALGLNLVRRQRFVANHDNAGLRLGRRGRRLGRRGRARQSARDRCRGGAHRHVS
jgi:hypothetical protein